MLISVNRSTSFLPSDIGRGEATKRLSHELKRAFCSPRRTRRMLPTSFRQCLRAKRSSLASLSVLTVPRPAGHQSSRASSLLAQSLYLKHRLQQLPSFLNPSHRDKTVSNVLELLSALSLFLSLFLANSTIRNFSTVYFFHEKILVSTYLKGACYSEVLVGNQGGGKKLNRTALLV